MPNRRGLEFIEELTHTPQLVTQLLADHFPDANGRCAGCAQDDRLREPYPCGPRGHAVAAQKLIDARQRAPRPAWTVR